MHQHGCPQHGCAQVAYGHISDWDTGMVVSLYCLFCRNARFNSNINAWQTSKVANMADVFSYTAVFNQPLDAWDTSSVKGSGNGHGMWGMFNEAKAFNQSIRSWKVCRVDRCGRKPCYFNSGSKLDMAANGPTFAAATFSSSDALRVAASEWAANSSATQVC